MEDFVKNVFEWDVINWSPAISVWEKKVNERSEKGNALELGGRRGGLSLWLAKKGYDVSCSDLENPEEIATPLHKRFNVQEKIKYIGLDATNIPYENHFDIIAFKSILGGIGRNDQIENQQETINQAYKALKKGGLLLFAENLSGSPMHKFFRKRFVKWGDSWRYVTQEEMQQFLGQFSSHEIFTTGFAGTFGRSEFQRNLLGRMDQLFFNSIVPNNWQYVSYGWAMK